jgi:hypothetical protein
MLMQAQQGPTQTTPPAPPAAPEPPTVAAEAPQLAQAPQPAQAPGASGGSGISEPRVVIDGVDATPTAILEGARAARSELREQLEELTERREEIAEELRPSPGNRPEPTGADRLGLEARITDLDARIKQTEELLQAADLRVAQAAAVPGAVQPDPPPPPRSGPPEEVFVLGGLFIGFVLFPLTIAYARRLWKRGAVAVSAIPKELYERFARLEQSVDSIAFEVERIGEGQRFMTRVFTDNTEVRGIAAGVAREPELVAPEPPASAGPRAAGRDR